ncbi:MAG: hypothetical protein ABJA74_05525 [Lapillicoccus sp.]
MKRRRELPTGRRLVVRVVLLYAVTMVVLVLLDVSPSPILVAAFFLAAATVFAVFSERFASSHSEAWVVNPPSTAGLGRGSDHRTSALARRLEARVNEPSQRRNLAGELQKQLKIVLADRVRRERGWDILAHPELAHEALPSDLADIVTRPPDLRLADAQYLSALLDRIESP